MSVSRILLAFAIVIGSFFVGGSIVNEYVKTRKVLIVKGVSEKEILAEKGEITINIEVKKESLDEAKQLFFQNIEAVKAFLISKGIQETEITLFGNTLREDFVGDQENKNLRSSYVFSCSIKVISDKVDQIEQLAQSFEELTKNGVFISSTYGPNYSMKGVQQFRTDMITDAAKNGRAIAQQMAKDMGFRVGKVKSANQGSIQIESNAAKKIKYKLVSHFTFFIR